MSQKAEFPLGVSPLRRPVSWALIAVVRLYKLILSPLIGGHCKYLPTCSDYFIEAVIRKGAVLGALKGVWRICRCNPFAKSRYDPVK